MSKNGICIITYPEHYTYVSILLKSIIKYNTDDIKTDVCIMFDNDNDKNNIPIKNFAGSEGLYFVLSRDDHSFATGIPNTRRPIDSIEANVGVGMT